MYNNSNAKPGNAELTLLSVPAFLPLRGTSGTLVEPTVLLLLLLLLLLDA
jgi:hypothetical protein